MTEDDDQDEGSSGFTRQDLHLVIMIFLGALIAVQAWDVIDVNQSYQQIWGSEPTGGEDLAILSESLFTDWVIPFEVLSLLLLVALVGAVAMAMRDPATGGEP